VLLFSTPLCSKNNQKKKKPTNAPLTKNFSQNLELFEGVKGPVFKPL
jgi:hypothetical protein